MAQQPNDEGFVHLYHGPGKGKTTAAMGLAARAVGHDLSVTVLQFMKGAAEMREQYGEVQLFREMSGIDVEQFPAGHARTKDDLSSEERERLVGALEQAAETVGAAEADVVVLDELLTLYTLELADEDRLLDIVEARDKGVEVVITGREAPPGIVDAADYVSYVGDVKHPFRKGVSPRLGIEF